MCPGCRTETTPQDRFCRHCGASLAVVPELSSRKNVVVLFIDLVGSTTLAEGMDPEPLRVLMDRYYRVCTEAIGEHGGVIEKFIGDAVMAVFGMPVAHEDDAARAVRAALEVTAGVRGLGGGLDVHSGIFSGEVIATALPTGDLRVVGDAVNTAARLQSAAGAGEILIGKSVAQAVRDLMELRPVPSLTLKGKAKPVPAWLVIAPKAAPERARAPFVGRAGELKELEQAFRRVVRKLECRVVTVLGVPGLGKTRLVREFLAALPPQAARVLTGHCQSYGKGITYQPIVELFDDLPGGAELAAYLAADRGVEEIAWVVRRQLEELAARMPLIVVCEDLHWAEPTLLDLLEELAAGLSGLPVLLICVARPELLETRPGWVSAATVDLGPLAPDELDLLLAHLEPDVVAHSTAGTLERVAEASGGNPLFAELMMDMLAEGDENAIPPTIQALLTARIDRLPPRERQVLARASAFGRHFSGDGVAALHDVPEEVPGALAQVQRRRLVERDGSGFRFAQALTRDVVYSMSPKAERRGWHLRIADRVKGLPETAYHLEAACLLAREVSPADPANVPLARRAAAHLAEAGAQALTRKDLSAAVNLLERALVLMPVEEPGHRVLVIRLCDAYVLLGRREEAAALLERSTPAFADTRGRHLLGIQRHLLALRYGSAMPYHGAEPEAGDHFGWCRMQQVRALTWLAAGQIGRAEQAMRAAVDHARALGDLYEEKRLLIARCELAQWSPAPLEEGLALCAGLAERFAGDRALLVMVLFTEARLRALRGEIEAAHGLLDRADGHARDLNLGLAGAAVTQARALVCSLAGDHIRSADLYGEAARALHAMSLPVPARTLRVYAARERFQAGAGLDDVPLDGLELRAELVVRCLRARAGSMEHAETALALLDGTDDPCLRGDVLAEIARAWHEHGRAAEATVLACRARDHYLGRGATLPAARVAAWLESPDR
ncbi:adenylate/guanylate cyclase domain-containing protein [Nonomuraea soli]|uniref:Class 3 adenylate cyclase n=1 Tax=Nonomuraea soli TaxID=1032476 RepID=A0A7W0CJK0_9ACTN|nr:adenylate/guanylate cyclase domain-containing protein [Nonomuraea soli]MBA2892320.1 class 3 adenylate cyclase [Nonomuraea soli]